MVRNVLLLTCLLLISTFASPTMDKKVFLHPKDMTPSLESRIIGGMEASPHKYPFQVILEIIKNGTETNCGGTLYSNLFVLTAAHCLDMYPERIIVALGAHNLINPSSTEVVLTTTTYVIHEHYDRHLKQNDIGLVEFPESVTFTDRIKPVEIAEGRDTYVGKNGKMLGWGKTNSTNWSHVLIEVESIIISNQECAAEYGRVIRPTHVCTSGKGITDICSGDSGGPLLVKGIQVGIASFIGKKNCSSGWPSVFTRVSEYHDWIVRNTNEASTREGTPFAVTVAVALCLVR